MVVIGLKAGTKISSVLSTIGGFEIKFLMSQIAQRRICANTAMRSGLTNFYDRIMNQSDPLAMYRKATRPQPVAKPKQHCPSPQLQYTYPVQPVSSKKKVRKATGWIVLLIVAALIGLFFVLKYLVN